jgi:hypothetical protein
MREAHAYEPITPGAHRSASSASGNLAYGTYRGVTLPQRQIEVTAGGRVWYLVDEETRRVIVRHAGTGHPKITE